MVTETRTKEDRSRAWRLGELKSLRVAVGRAVCFGGPVTDDEVKYNHCVLGLCDVLDKLIEEYSR